LTAGAGGGAGGRDEEPVEAGIVTERDGDGGIKIGGNPPPPVVASDVVDDAVPALDAVDLVLSARLSDAVLNCARLEREGDGRIMMGLLVLLLVGTCRWSESNRCWVLPKGLRPSSSVGRSSSEWPWW
jgi:hypothetical protein